MPPRAMFIIFIFTMFPTIIVVALATKLWEVRKAKSWHSTTGRVITSRVRSRKKRPGDEGYGADSDVTNEPEVEYTYQVGNRRHRCGRITIGERTSADELEAILARYPVGATVTVYYDPARPEKAVLERDLPTGMLLAGAGCLLVFFVAGPLLAVLFYFGGLGLLKPYVRTPERVPFVTAATGFGVLLLMFTIAFHRVTAQARKWPATRGRIIASGVETFQHQSDEGVPATHYKPTLLYTYEVSGRQYQGDRVTIGVRWSGTIPAVAKRSAAKYVVGQEVDVYYDPKKPGESVLKPYSYWPYLLWALTAGVFVMAWAVATYS